MRTCSCTPPLASVERLVNESLATYQISALSVQPFPRYKKGAHARTFSCTPPLTFAKRLANGCLKIYQISAQSVKPFPRYGEGGISARAHVDVPFPMTCAISISAWSLNTRQIWLKSADPFLIYSLAANFDILHAARAICEGDTPNEPNLPVSNFFNRLTTL